MLSKLIDVYKVGPVSLGDMFQQRSGSILDVLEYLERLQENLKHPGPTIIKFSQSSVRDYLLQRHDDADFSRSSSFSEDMAHRFIAKSCLAYIQSMPETAGVGNKAYGVSWTCLSRYLADHWHTHAARLPEEEPESLTHLLNEVHSAVIFLLMAKDEYTYDSLRDMVGMEKLQIKPLSPEQKLQYAACSSFSCVVDGVLASNPDVDLDASSELGGNALSFACERRHWQIANTLLKRGADPNKHDRIAAPLLHASMHGADDIVQQLIGHSANVNIVCDIDDENTPLTAAILACHPSTVKLLLINEADPDLDSYMGSSIFVAARYGRHECMDLLLKHRASLEALDIESSSLLEYASASGSIETVKLLLTQGLDVDEEHCFKPLHADEMLPASTYSLKYPDIGIEQPRPQFSFPYSSYHKSYGSPMHAAAAYGHTEVIKLVVENKRGRQRKVPPLGDAVNSGQIERSQRSFGTSVEQRWRGVETHRGLV